MDEIKAGSLSGWVEMSRDDLIYFTFPFSELESLMTVSEGVTEFTFKSGETICVQITIEDAVVALREFAGPRVMSQPAALGLRKNDDI